MVRSIGGGEVTVEQRLESQREFSTVAETERQAIWAGWVRFLPRSVVFCSLTSLFGSVVLITAIELNSRSRQDLAEMAREFGISGLRKMKKDELVVAIRKAQDSSVKKTGVPGAKQVKEKPAAKSKPLSKDRLVAKEKIVAKGNLRSAKSVSKPVAAVKATKPKTVSTRSAGAAGSTAQLAKSQVVNQSRSSSVSSSNANAAGTTRDKVRTAKTDTAKVLPVRANASRGGMVTAHTDSSKRSASKSKSVAPKAMPLDAKISATKVNGATKTKAAVGSVSATRTVQALSNPPKPASSSRSPTTSKPTPVAAKKPAPVPPPPTPQAPVSAKSARIRREMALRSQRAMQDKDISSDVLVGGTPIRANNGQHAQTPHKDRIILIVRDCFWLQADWEITRAAVERVRVAMSEKWHNAIPVVRLMSVADASANRAEQILRDIPIHGGVSSWYIDVDEPPSRYRVVIGYVADNDRFFPICRSNVVETPRPGAANRIDEHWRDIAEDYERIFSLSGGLDVNGSPDLKEAFEDRLKRSMPSRGDASSGSDTDAALDRHRALPFEVDAEMIIYGSTVPGATVMLGGDPVKLRPDGTFTIRVALPDKRQVFPVVAQSRDGMRQRTTVVAVERNTKVMEAIDRDSNF